MRAVILIVAVVLVAVGVIFNRLNPRPQKEDVRPSEVLSEQKEEASPTKTSKEASPTVTASPIPSKPVMKTNISDYRYPNSETLSSSGNTLSLKSFDDPKIVTNWYKEKIITEGMNVKTFVETKANDNVLNKLVGADGQKEIRVEIKKDAGTSIVQIEVFLPGQ